MINSCPNAYECVNGGRYGKGVFEDHLNSAMGGKPWLDCVCGVDKDGNIPEQGNEMIDSKNDEKTQYKFKNIERYQNAVKLAIERKNRAVSTLKRHIPNAGESIGYYAIGYYAPSDNFYVLFDQLKSLVTDITRIEKEICELENNPSEQDISEFNRLAAQLKIEV